MAYLVDGNNVMGQIPGWHRDKRAARFRLLEQLSQFQRIKRIAISVIFDGAPEANFPDGSSYKGVRIYYSERGSDADTRIKKMVETHRQPKSLTVVTSDNRLISYVRLCSAAIQRSGEFRKEMETALASSPPDSGAAEPDADDVEGWMRYFGVDETDDEID